MEALRAFLDAVGPHALYIDDRSMSGSVKAKRKSVITLLYLILFLAVSLNYILYVNPSSAYMGFNIDIDVIRIIFSVCIIVIFSSLTPADDSVRAFFLNIILTIQLVPSLVLYSLAGKSTDLAFVIWVAIAIVYAVSALPMPRGRLMRINPRHLLWMLLVTTGGLIAALSFLGGFGNFNLDIRQVYEFRSAAAEALPGIFAYLMPIFSKIVIPFGLILSIYYRKYTYFFVFIAASIILFGVSNHRGIIIYPIMTIFIFYALNLSNQYSSVLILLISALVVAMIDSVLFFSIGQESIWGWYVDLFVRRGLMIPALLDYHHIEFFSENPKYFWASSRLSFGMVQNPYGIQSPNVIGEAYFNNVENAAGTGFIGSGFAQAGMVGVVLYSVGVGIVIAILQAFGRYLGLPLVAAVMIVQIATMLTATDFVTMFLTHGLFASFILLAIIRAPQGRRAAGRREAYRAPMAVPQKG